ncbi:MAG: hypothetical protein HYX96_06130 [Chloroflexi bacterium]|nr:hypothetical protein [Chloroflexota bacterium]
MNPFYGIQGWFTWATQVLIDAALFCYGHWPLQGLGDFFNRLSDFTARTAGEFWTLGSWYDGTTQRLAQALSWVTIRAQILAWLPDLPAISAWWISWGTNVQGMITAWWAGEAARVSSWIGAAREELLGRLREMVSFSWFSAWWGNAGATFSAWWTSQAAEISGRTEAALAPVRETVNRQSNVIELLTGTGDAALRWLLDRIETALARLW